MVRCGSGFLGVLSVDLCDDYRREAYLDDTHFCERNEFGYVLPGLTSTLMKNVCVREYDKHVNDPSAR